MSIIQGKKILIVDDDLGCRESIRLNLESKGAITLQAENGDDALVILKNNSFDLITTGIRMPGLSGIDLIKVIKEQGIPTPIIVICGPGGLQTLAQAQRIGAMDFIPKPFKIDYLISSVERVLGIT